MRIVKRHTRCLALLSLSASLVLTATAPAVDLAEMSLEELLGIEVIMASRRPERLSDASAAAFVITRDDLHRSGVTELPEALRMVPGIHIGRINTHTWAITSRGFNNFFANKLFVMVDGRPVFQPLFAGVFWETQDLMPEDVERIEVIRGPGAALWGANAVNGVVNIVTQNSQSTQGGVVSLGGGTYEHGFLNIRQGGTIGANAFYRAYGRYTNRGGFVYDTGDDASDGWTIARGGYRVDWRPTEQTSLSVHNDFYDGTVRHNFQVVTSIDSPYVEVFDYAASLSGAYVLTRCEHELSNRSSLSLQLTYDWGRRDDGVGKGAVHTIDADFQHRLSLHERHDLIWGVGSRVSFDHVDGTFTFSFVPRSRTTYLLSGFIQDEFAVIPDRLGLTVGSKFEQNSATGYEVQPEARVMWKPGRRTTVWAGVARAVRTPTRFETDVRYVMYAEHFPPNPPVFPDGGTALAVVTGNEDMPAGSMMAYQLGLRTQPREDFSLDVAAYYNVYRKLTTLERGTPTLPLSSEPRYVVIPLVIDARMKGTTHGLEVAATWQPHARLRLRAAGTYFSITVDPDQDSHDVIGEILAGNCPRFQLHLRSMVDLPRNMTLDVTGRYVDPLKSIDVSRYVTLDARWGWQVFPELGISVTGRNLLQLHHREFRQPNGFIRETDVVRDVYAAMEWRF